MGQTIIEKILSKNLGRAVRAGDEALFEPDLTVAYDYPGYIDSYEKQMDELGVTSVAFLLGSGYTIFSDLRD